MKKAEQRSTQKVCMDLHYTGLLNPS